MRDKRQLLKREPSVDDAWCTMAYEQAARSMAAWLKGSINTERPIRSLKLPELDAMAQAAIHTWIVLGTQREEWVKARRVDNPDKKFSGFA